LENLNDVITMIIIEELKQTPTEKQRVEIVERKIE
jgi:S-adenosylmethionine synthetase